MVDRDCGGGWDEVYQYMETGGMNRLVTEGAPITPVFGFVIEQVQESNPRMSSSSLALLP